MKKYTMEDLHVIEGGAALIRKKPDMYAGPKPWGHNFSARLMEDLIFLEAQPARIEKTEHWWVLSSDKDWLASPEGDVSLDPFSRIIPFPAKGLFAFRTEVVIAALADAVITCGRDGLKWINGDPDRWPPSSELVNKISSVGMGRAVAFTIGDER